MSRFICKYFNCLTVLKNNSYQNRTFSIDRFRNYYCTHRNYGTSKESETSNDKSNNGEIYDSKNKKYDIFRDDDSSVILDVDEERDLYREHPELYPTKEKTTNAFEGINLTRGETGVFDVEELVSVLRKENTVNIVVIAVPEEFHYVDYMVITSPLSSKHMLSVAEYIRKLYKRKCNPDEGIPCIEGESSKEWMALDLGNIALHILSKQARKKFDLETLWAIGPKYDKRLNEEEDPLITLLEEHTSLANLEPVDEEKPVMTKEDEDNNQKQFSNYVK